MSRLIEYFDLGSTRRAIGAKAQAASATVHVFPQYVALVLGIVLEPYFNNYRQTHAWDWTIEGVAGRLLFSVIVGVMIFPAVYKNAFDEAKPIFVQICPIFTAGVGWQALLTAAVKAVGPA